MRSVVPLTLLAVLLLPAVTGVSNSGATDVAAPLCDAPVRVPGQGLSCPAPAGWAVPLPDGTVLYTHGPDPVPEAPVVLPGLRGAASTMAATPGEIDSAAVACVYDETQPHARVIYAYPVEGPDRTDTLVPAILAGVHQANAVLLANALPHGYDMRFRVLCRPDGSVDVATVGMSVTRSQADFSSIVGDLRDQGFRNQAAKYWVVYDGRVACNCGGQGNVAWDDRPGPENRANDGDMWALSYYGNYGSQGPAFSLSQVMLHEATHTMGGVQLTAPHTSGAWHCTDGGDIMCYSDGGPYAGSFRWTSCPRVPDQYSLAATWPYDCGNDDYFHPEPEPQSWLSASWNVGGANNKYLTRTPVG